MAIRTLLVPFAYMAAFILRKLKVSAYAIVTFSFLVILVVAASFYMVFASPFNTDFYVALTVAGIFLTGFVDEVLRELNRAKKLPGFPLALAKHSDFLLVIGILYVSMIQPYGVIPELGLAQGSYAAIAAFFIIGVLLADYISRKIESRDPGIETRAERMFILTGFVFIGLYLGAFEKAVLAGTIILTAMLYAWAIIKKFDFYIAGEALYYNIMGLAARITRGRLAETPKPKTAAGGEAPPQEGFQEYEEEDYPATGHSFTVVVNDRRSEPVSNAKATLNNIETGDVYTGYTDPSGRNVFSGVSEGQYEITLECEGFASTKHERYISMDSGEVFTLKRPFTDLSIVITDRSKTTPVPGAKVMISQKGGGASALETKKTADNLGVAYFEELDVEVFNVHVRAKGYSDWQREVNLEEENVISVTLEKGTKQIEPAKEQAPQEAVEKGPSPKPAEQPQKEEKKEASISEVLSESAIFEYYSPDDVLAHVKRMVDEYKKNGIDVYLVSTPERALEYKGIDVKIVDVPEKPDQFNKVLEEMPAGSVLIFEPLSNLIITSGFDEAFKFLKKTLAYMKAEGLTLACFVNPRAHDDKQLEKLRKTLKSVKIEGDKILK